MDRHEICKQVWYGVTQALKPTVESFSPIHKKSFGKTKNFANHGQSEAHNFKMARHVDKQITDVSSTVIVLKQDTKLAGIIPRGFDATELKQLINYK